MCTLSHPLHSGSLFLLFWLPLLPCCAPPPCLLSSPLSLLVWLLRSMCLCCSSPCHSFLIWLFPFLCLCLALIFFFPYSYFCSLRCCGYVFCSLVCFLFDCVFFFASLSVCCFVHVFAVFLCVCLFACCCCANGCFFCTCLRPLPKKKHESPQTNSSDLKFASTDHHLRQIVDQIGHRQLLMPNKELEEHHKRCTVLAVFICAAGKLHGANPEMLLITILHVQQ